MPATATLTCHCGKTYTRPAELAELPTVVADAVAAGWELDHLGTHCPECQQAKIRAMGASQIAK